MFYVYALFRSDGSPFWIGKGSGDRARASSLPTRHKSRKTSIIRRTRREIGEVPYVILHSNLDEETAFAYERELIMAIGQWPNGPLVNIAIGGGGTFGQKFSDERKRKIANALTGNKNAAGTIPSPETRRKLSETKIGNQHAKGHKQSPEHIEKRRIASALWRQTPEGQAFIHRKRSGHSAETRAKISATLRSKNTRG